MMKKVTAILLSVAMLICLLPAVVFADTTYGDTKGHWAESSIDRWSEYEVVRGDGTSFNPDGVLTRAEAAQVFANLLGLNKEADITEYTDIGDEWYTQAIAKCVAAGILGGRGDGIMDPKGTVTREEFLTMYARAVCISNGENVSEAKEMLSSKGFADTGNVSDWAAEAISTLVEKGYVNGLTATSLAPQATINRASVMALLDKSISTYVGKNSTETKVEAKSTGITLIANPAVTDVTGSADIVVVAAGAEQYNETTGEITHSDIRVESANMPVARVQGENITVTLAVNTEAKDAAVTKTGENSEIVVDSTAKVEKLTISADGAKATVAGRVGTVAVEETAKNATVTTQANAVVTTVENNAENTKVTGEGTVTEVKSSENVTIETKNTKVENTNEEKEIAVTDSKGTASTVTTTTEGSSTTATTVNTETTPTATSGGGHTTPTHTHTYASGWTTDETYHWHASTCGHNVVSGKVEHSFDETTLQCECGRFSPSAIAAIGNQGYTSLTAALNAVVSGDSIKLLTDVAVQLNDTGSDSSTADKTLWLGMDNTYTNTGLIDDVTFDFDNHKLTIKSNNGGSYNTLNIFGSGWTLKNGEIVVLRKNGGTPVANTDSNYDVNYPNWDSYALSVEDTDATFTMDNMTLHGGVALYGGVAATIKNTNNIMATNYYALYLEADPSEGTPSAIIAGGNYQSASNSIICAETDCDVEISGGTFDGTIFTGEGSLSITGGTYTSDPSTYVSGYKVEADKPSSGKWTVEPLFNGNGTKENPYIITCREEFLLINQLYSVGYKYYEVDPTSTKWSYIDNDGHPHMDGSQWPLGTDENNRQRAATSLWGYLDCKGLIIDNLDCTLFRHIGVEDNSDNHLKGITEIKNVTINRVSDNRGAFGTYDCSAGVARDCGNWIALTNVNVHGCIEGSSSASYIDYGCGNIGSNTIFHLSFINCYSDATIIATSGQAAGFIVNVYTNSPSKEGDIEYIIIDSLFNGDIYSTLNCTSNYDIGENFSVSGNCYFANNPNGNYTNNQSIKFCYSNDFANAFGDISKYYVCKGTKDHGQDWGAIVGSEQINGVEYNTYTYKSDHSITSIFAYVAKDTFGNYRYGKYNLNNGSNPSNYGDTFSLSDCTSDHASAYYYYATNPGYITYVAESENLTSNSGIYTTDKVRYAKFQLISSGVAGLSADKKTYNIIAAEQTSLVYVSVKLIEYDAENRITKITTWDITPKN